MRHGHRWRERGAALLVVMMLTGILLMFVLAILLTTGEGTRRAVAHGKKSQQLDCAEAGLELAKDYYSANQGNWSTYLADPVHYNPVCATWMKNSASCPAGASSVTNQSPVATATQTAANPLSTAAGSARQAHPELFADLDGDGNPDVYMYIRDNQDEFPPASNDWTHDNDQEVYVGAVCISTTMVPVSPSGQQANLSTGTYQSLMAAEVLLSNNVGGGNAYKGQAGSGPSGNGNIN